MVCSTGGTLHLIVSHTLPDFCIRADTHQCCSHNIHFHGQIVQMWQQRGAPAASFLNSNCTTQKKFLTRLSRVGPAVTWEVIPTPPPTHNSQGLFLLVVAVCFFQLDANFAAAV